MELFKKIRNLCEYISFGEIKYVNKNIQIKCYPSNYCIGSCNYIIINNVIMDKKKIGFISKSCNNNNRLCLDFEENKFENVNMIYYRKVCCNSKIIEIIKEKDENIMKLFIENSLKNNKNIIIVSKMNGIFYSLLDKIINDFKVKYDKVCILDMKSDEYIRILTHMPEFMNMKIQLNMYK